MTADRPDRVGPDAGEDRTFRSDPGMPADRRIGSAADLVSGDGANRIGTGIVVEHAFFESAAAQARRPARFGDR